MKITKKEIFWYITEGRFLWIPVLIIVLEYSIYTGTSYKDGILIESVFGWIGLEILFKLITSLYEWFTNVSLKKNKEVDKEDSSELLVGSSSKLLKGEIPDICFVCAPFGGRGVPDDLGDWAKHTQALAAASVLGIVDKTQFEIFQKKFSKTKTVLVPDITTEGVFANEQTEGSMLHLASLVMQHKLGLIPSEWECLSMAYEQDALGRCSPVGVLFVFKNHNR